MQKNILHLLPDMLERLDTGGALVLSGREHPRLLRVSWGSFGTLWDKSIFMLAIRPGNFSLLGLRRDPYFTVNFFADPQSDRAKRCLQLCAKEHGYPADKLRALHLSTAASQAVPTPNLRECALVLECQTLCRQPLEPQRLPQALCERFYRQRDVHELFFGEILSAYRR